MVVFSCSPDKDYWLKAREEFAARDFLGCILQLNMLLENQPASDSVLVMRAHCYNRVEKHDKAEADLIHALRLNPASLGAKLEYARLLAYRTDTSGALSMLSAPVGSKQGRMFSDFMLEKARILFYTRQYPESLYCLDQAISADSTNPEAWFLRGAFYASTLTGSSAYFQPQTAVNNYRKAILCNPRFAEAYYKLAITQFDVFSDKNSAMKNLSLAIRLDPYHTDYYLERAMRYHQYGNPGAARKDYLKVLELNPLDSVAQAGLQRLDLN